MEEVSKWKFYEIQEFFIVQNQNLGWAGTLVMSINCNSVHLAEPKNRSEPIMTWTFPQIVTWGASPVKMLMVVGNLQQNRRYTFLTKQAQVITNLMMDYVSLCLRANNGLEAI
jgi:hypothetical protein